MTSDLGLTPSNDGNLIRLIIPQLTQERRKELTKLVGKLTEEGKVALRNVRRDALKALEKLEKDKALSEDQLTAAKDAIQKLTDGCGSGG
jgi:ribosome recycling factor